MHSFEELLQFFLMNINNLHVWLDFIWSVVTYNVIMSLLYKVGLYEHFNRYPMPYNHYLLWRFMITLYIFIAFFLANPAINWTVFHKLLHPTIWMVSAHYLYKWGHLF